MTRFVRSVLVFVAALGLAACLVPEKFDASIRIKPDGGYTYEYEGTAVHFLAAAAIKEKGRLSAKDEDGLKREAEKAAKAPGVKKMAYMGDGRFDMQFKEDLKLGQQISSLKIFTITRDKDGAFVVAAPSMKDQERDQLRSLGIKVAGTVEVVLPANAKVLSHNAAGTPGIFSKSYSWKIGAVDARPMIKFLLDGVPLGR